MNGARVLVCDDDPQILRALRVVLRDAGYDVIPAETGEEALDRMAVRPPEAAIIDLMLPGIDGVEVCRRLREWSQIPVIVLSAVDEESEKVRALRSGADDYVTKPFAPDELLARLEAASVLRTHIANLRGKIEGPGHQRRFIRTDSGVGYRFVA